MSDLWGANPDELDVLAERLATSATRLDELRSGALSLVRTSAWQGHDADSYRTQWEAQGMRLLSTASATLRAAGTCARTNAEAQRRASEAAGGEIGGGGTSGGGPMAFGGPDGGPGSATAPPEPGGGFSAAIAATRSAMEDELDRRNDRLDELEDQLDGADGGLEEWFKDVVPVWDSDAQAIRGQIDAERREVERLEALLEDPDRQYLLVDVEGDGRIIEVHGDLTGAEHVALFVPGMDTSIDNYTDHPHDYAANLFDEMQLRAGPDEDVAVVSFLDYNPPDMDWSLPLGAGELRASEGADNLASMVGDLRDSGYTADQLTVVGHSYGSTVTGIALEHEDLGVSTVAVVGSPGLGDGVDDISDLGRPEVSVYAGRAEGVPLPGGSGDPVSWLPFHGEDPADSGFGAERFDTGGVSGHSGYFTPESESLRNLALIALGREPSLR